MASPADPLINLRARTQIVQGGITRYMGETWQLPKREALGFLQTSEAEQVVDPLRPRTWMQSAPGPMENFNLPGDFANQGSREGAIGNNRGGTPGDQQTRQIQGWQTTTNLSPQQYDDYRNPSQAGLTGATDQQWQTGATGATSGAPGAFTFSPQRPEATSASIPPGGFSTPLPAPPGIPPFRPERGRGPGRRPGPATPPHPGRFPPFAPGREERRDEPHRGRRQDRREADHERRSDRYDQRHAEADHERRSERYDQRRIQLPPHQRRSDQYDRRHSDANHERREDRYDRRHENDRGREDTGRRGRRNR